MLVFRCTKRAAARFKLELTQSSAVSSGILGDWYVNLLNLGSTRLVLCVSERSLLPLVLPARNEVFPSQFGVFLGRLLRRLEVKEASAFHEKEQASDFLFLPTRGRPVLGVMRDYARIAEGDLSRCHGDLLELSCRLAGAPMSPIDYESPDRLACTLLAATRTQ